LWGEIKKKARQKAQAPEKKKSGKLEKGKSKRQTANKGKLHRYGAWEEGHYATEVWKKTG